MCICNSSKAVCFLMPALKLLTKGTETDHGPTTTQRAQFSTGQASMGCIQCACLRCCAAPVHLTKTNRHTAVAGKAQIRWGAGAEARLGCHYWTCAATAGSAEDSVTLCSPTGLLCVRGKLWPPSRTTVLRLRPKPSKNCSASVLWFCSNRKKDYNNLCV
jgi:hypothetical protein